MPLDLLPADGPDRVAWGEERRSLIAKRLRIRMIELDLHTQRMLQARTGLARGTLERVLHARSVTFDTYARLAEALDTTVADLVAPETPERLGRELQAIVRAYQQADTDVRLKVRRLLFGVVAELTALGEHLADAALAETPPERPARPLTERPTRKDRSG